MEISIVIKVQKIFGNDVREGDRIIVKSDALSSENKVKKVCGFRELNSSRSKEARIAVFDDNTARVLYKDKPVIVLFPVINLKEVRT